MTARLSSSFALVAILALCSAWAPPAGADPVTDLHSSDVLVHDQGAATRASALKDALAQVLVKVTGSQASLETAEAAAMLENPSRYLQQYRYEAVHPVPEDPQAARLVLHTEFDGTAIEQRLRAAGLPLWGRERPLTLAWIAFSNDNDRNIVGNDPAPLVDALQRAAQRRGLPMVLPEMDARDATRVSFMDVWGVYEEPLLEAAARYAPDAVLVGGIFKAGNELWAGRWTLLSEGQRQKRWEASGASPEAIATGAVDALAEYFATEFAVVAASAGASNVIVEVLDVEQLQGYAKIQSYLAGLSVVKDVHLLRVDDDRLRFALELNGTARTLEQSIALGRVLEPAPPEAITVPLDTVGNENDGSVPEEGRAASEGEPVASGEARPANESAMTAATPVLRYRYRR